MKGAIIYKGKYGATLQYAEKQAQIIEKNIPQVLQINPEIYFLPRPTDNKTIIGKRPHFT